MSWSIIKASCCAIRVGLLNSSKLPLGCSMPGAVMPFTKLCASKSYHSITRVFLSHELGTFFLNWYSGRERGCNMQRFAKRDGHLRMQIDWALWQCLAWEELLSDAVIFGCLHARQVTGDFCEPGSGKGYVSPAGGNNYFSNQSLNSHCAYI